MSSDQPIVKPIVDLDVINNFGPTMAGIFNDVVNAGFQDIEDQINNMRGLESTVIITSETRDIIVRAAHSIKSCSAQMAGAELSEFAKDKEQQYLEVKELESLQSDICEFERLFERLKSEMQVVLENRAKQS